MRPVFHIIAAISGSVPVYIATKSLDCALIYGSTVVFIDIDHLLDYVLWNKRPINLKGFLKMGNAGNWSRVLFIMHGYEWLLILIVLDLSFQNIFVYAMTAGYFVHILMDETGNRLPSCRARIKPLFYLLSYRAAMGFKIDKICYGTNMVSPQNTSNLNILN
ncbi:MAG: hypothetical protein HQK99_04380 [Nitrospirae bacterium]|nr:hypothetical protein [Nitrospirota bacterium]